MAMETLSVEELLKKGEGDFDSLVQTMPSKTLMDFISRLQKEMTKEQENFNSLNAELQNRKERNSRQSKQISKDMALSQQRLTLLMSRSMKCFAQQNRTPTKQGTQLVRRNSAKGSQPIVSPAQKTTNVHRSRSMHVVNKLNELSTPVQPQPSSHKVGVVASHPRQPVIKSAVNGNVPNIGGRNVTMNASSSVSSTPPPPPSSSSHDLNPPTTDARRANEKKAQLYTGEGNSSGGGLQRNTVPVGVSGVTSSSSGSSSTSSPSALPPKFSSPAAADTGGGGIYVKRRQGGQLNNVTELSVPPKRPVSSSYTSLAASSSSSSSSHSGNVIVLKKSQPRPASFASSHNPLQLASSRAGVSHSQIIGQETKTSDLPENGRGLPSVKMLAKSFGSATALHVTPSSSSNPDNRSARSTSVVMVSGKPFARSSSNIASSADVKKAGPHHTTSVSLVKGNAASAQPAVVVNGKAAAPAPQQQKVSQQAPQGHNVTSVRVSSDSGVKDVSQNSNGRTELEMARSKLKSNRHSTEIITESSGSEASGNVVVNGSDNRSVHGSNSSGSTTAEEEEAKQKQQRIAENTRVGTYLKKNDDLPMPSPSSASSSASQAPSAAKPTMVTISSSKAKSAPPVSVQEMSISSNNSNGSSSNATNGKPVSSVVTTNGKAGNIRLSRSKEELNSEVKSTKPMPDRASLMKQIESRRVDIDNDQQDGVFRSTAKLSSSTTSLGSAGKFDKLLYFLCLFWRCVSFLYCDSMVWGRVI